jgi:hypothetical protein
MQSVVTPSITNVEELTYNIFLLGWLTPMQYLWLLKASQMPNLLETDQVLINRVFYGIRHGLLQIVASDQESTVLIQP